MAAKGRPTRYTKVLGEALCLEIAKGKSLRKACAEHPDLDASTVIGWVLNPNNAAFSKQYAHARRIQAELRGDEIFDIADDATLDQTKEVIGTTEDGKPIEIKHVDHEHIQRSKLRVDTRKWYLSKVLPKVYGDKVEGEQEKKKELPPLIRYGEGPTKE